MNNGRRKRVTYRPSKSQAIVGGIGGAVFVLVGLILVIPAFGLFGILWTLFAVVITGVNLYQGFGKGYVGPEIQIEEDGEDFSPTNSAEKSGNQERLTELRTLYDQRLITKEEYEQKRAEILKTL